MKVLFVAAEMAPLVKVGGLGDVAGSLPGALRALGLDVRVALPRYATIKSKALALERITELPEGAAVWRTDVADVPTYLVEHEGGFGREQVYGYEDDAARFLLFGDALLAAASELDWRPDALHLNDWHACFLPIRLAGREHPWARAAQVLTMHNLAFTGPFGAAFAQEHGIEERSLIMPDGVKRAVARSALAQAILRADQVVTVSPTYAQEILTPAYGGPIAPLLQQRRDRLHGVMNGIDTSRYDPANDPHLSARFDSEHLEHRGENKRALQQRVGLPVVDDVPLLGMVSRLFEQKGPDLVVAAVERLLPSQRVQLAVLGQGDEEHERSLNALFARHPDRVAVRIDFDEALGQLIYGGCDMFLMPSRYEPCGLGQFIAMRYGAVPVVRRTGGLADSVEAYQPPDRGTGFVFDEPSAEALAGAIEEALAVYHDREAWRRLQLRGMAQDWSWARSAKQYVEIYERAARLRAEAGAT